MRGQLEKGSISACGCSEFSPWLLGLCFWACCEAEHGGSLSAWEKFLQHRVARKQKEREKQTREPPGQDTALDNIPGYLLPPVRPQLLMFLDPPKMDPLAGQLIVKTWASLG